MCSLSSAIARRICKGEEDARNVPCTVKASAGTSTLLDPRKSNRETQISTIPGFVSSQELLLLTISLQSPAGLLMARMLLWWGFYIE